MPSGITELNVVDWMERNYQPPKLGNIAFKENPFISWLPHDENAGGDAIQLRWKYGNSQGHGATLTQAKARADLSGLKPAKVTLDYEPFYTVCTIDNLAIERALGGNLSAVDVVQEAINGSLEGHGDLLETFAFSDGYPALGQIAGISGSTFTVAADQIENWENDYEIVLAASRTTGALRAQAVGGVYLHVTKIDRKNDALLITCDAGIAATVTGAANGDFAFLRTTREDAGSPARQTMLGVPAFIPTTVGSSDAFGDNSLNRFVDPFRLAGLRLPIPAGTSVTQGLINFYVQCKKYKVKGDGMWCSYERWGDLISELGAAARPVHVENKKYGLTIVGVKLFTPDGEVSVFPSSKCPHNATWNLKRSTWKVNCVNGPLIRNPLKYGKGLDSASADSIEMRWRSFAQISCLRPHENGVGVWA